MISFKKSHEIQIIHVCLEHIHYIYMMSIDFCKAKEKQRILRFRKISKWAVEVLQSHYIRWKVSDRIQITICAFSRAFLRVPFSRNANFCKLS